MHSKNILLSVIVFMLLLFQCAYAEEGTENEYGFFEMKYIGADTLKIGEPAEIIVTVTSKSATGVFIKPSFRRGYFETIHDPDNFIPVADERITNLSERMDVFQLEPGWSKTFKWIIMPTEKAVGKQERISMIVDFSKDGVSNQLWVPVVRPRIINETYGEEANSKTNNNLLPSSGTGNITIENMIIYGIGAVVALCAVLLFFKRKPTIK